MICCENCFADYEIKAIINSLNRIGDCEVCNEIDVKIYNTESEISLIESFNGLLDIYTSYTQLPVTYPSNHLVFLKDELYNNWSIFSSSLSIDNVDNIIKNICKEKYNNEPEIFEDRIGIAELFDSNYLIKNSIVGKYSWEEFVDSIKNNNRFHNNHLNTEILKIICSYVMKNYNSGDVFYRARISDKAGFPSNEMGAPPSIKASPGRANPEGISYLYLGDNIQTTLYEIRAGLHDYVCVGTFKLKKDINIVDLTSVNKISAFSDMNSTQHAINRIHLEKINFDIAKPLRRHDSFLDYLPTQYICDFIKNISFNGEKEYQGIEYKSTMNPTGYNLAIFDENLFECSEVKVYDIESLTYVFNIM